MILNYFRIRLGFCILLTTLNSILCIDFIDADQSDKDQYDPDRELRKLLCGTEAPDNRFYQRTGKCYKAGTQGPCGNNMILYGQPDNTVYGTCDCSDSLDQRTLIYHRGSSRCYYIFTQAYCQQGQWLTLSRANGLPTCEPNLCLRNINNAENKLVYLDGKCVELNSKCGHNGGVVHFEIEHISPRCTPAHAHYAGAPGVPTTRCKPGSAISFSGNCVRNWVW